MFTKQNIIHITLDVLLITVLFLYVNNKHKSMNDAVEQLREYTEEQVDNLNSKIEKVIKYVTKNSPSRQPEIRASQYQRNEPDYITERQQPQRAENIQRSAPLKTNKVSSPKTTAPPQAKPQPQKKQVRFTEEEKNFEDDLISQHVLNENKEEERVEMVDDIEENSREEEEKRSLENFINNITPNFNIPFPQMPQMPQMNPMHFHHLRPTSNIAAFVSTTRIERTPQSQSTKIEVIEEEESQGNVNEEVKNLEEEKKEEDEKLDDLDMIEIEKAIGLKEN